MAKAIIFGIHGQDGYYLQQLLQRQQVEVTGVSRSAGNWTSGSVADFNFTRDLIRQYAPDYIFHLAATSSVQHELLFEHQSTILGGTLHILESVRQYVPACKVFITGSGLQFVNKGDPISEKDPFYARDAYSLARIQAVYAARYYRDKGTRAYVGYLFHHDSPLRSAQHLNRKIADAAKAAGAGQDISLTIGDYTVEKEFGFAGDIVSGMKTLVSQEHFFEACIGTGQAYPVSKWLECCFSTVQKDWRDYVRPEQGYVPDFKRLVSDPALIRSAGWEHKTSIDELAALMMAS